MDQSIRECDLKINFIATRSRTGGYGGYLAQAVRQLRYSFNVCRKVEGPLSCSAPIACSFLDQTSLSAVTRQKLGLVLGYFGELVLKYFSDASMKRAPRLA
jgi:hypothetical protein